MTTYRYIGVDPGKDGGVAWIDETQRGPFTQAYRMPKTPRDIYDLFGRAMNGVNPDCAFLMIEKVGSMPGQGVASTFKFGFNTGLLTGFIISVDVSYETVAPSKWQYPFSLMKGANVTNTQKKNNHKQRAQELFPAIDRITHATADALLIAEFCRRSRKGIL